MMGNLAFIISCTEPDRTLLRNKYKLALCCYQSEFANDHNNAPFLTERITRQNELDVISLYHCDCHSAQFATP